MCIVPGLGFNHGVRGFAQAFLSTFGFLGGSAAGLLAILVLDQKYHGLWTPVLFGFAIAFLLGFLPGVTPLLRWGYSMLLLGVATTGWMFSRPKIHKDLMDSWFRMGPKATLTVAVIGLLWFIIAYAAQKKRPPIFWMVTLVLEAGLVGYFSSPIGGNSNTVEILMRLLHVDFPTAHQLAFYIRKTLHFTFYGIIGFCGFRLARGSGVSGRSLLILGLSFAFCYACFDEIRQGDSPGRTSSTTDVLLDMAGASTFCGMAFRQEKTRSAKQESMTA